MSRPSQPFRVLLVGLGAAGQRHARNLRTLLGDGVEFLAWRSLGTSPVLTDRLQVEAGSSLEEKLALRSFPTLESALAERPDAVVIANPTSLHLPVARAAAGAGCHLYIEKPLSHSPEGILELIEIVEKARLVTVVGYQWRFHPLVERVRAALAGGAIGHVVSVQAEFGEWLPGWHPYEDYRQSYAARPELGGGVLLTQIHDFDYLGHLFGWPRRVFCVGGSLGSLEISVEDSASTLLECEREGRPLPVQLSQDFLQRPGRRRCRIVGTKGVVELDLAQASYQVIGTDGAARAKESLPDFDRNAPFLALMRHFLDCIRDGQPSQISVREGAKSLLVAHSALRSLRTGEVIALPPQ